MLTNSVGDVPEVLGTSATHIDCTPDAFADAIEQVMPWPAVEQDLEELRWSGRAKDLLAAMERK